VGFQRTDVDAITFLSGAEGTVEVTELEALPPRDPEQPAELVLPVDIDVPPALDDQPATVRFDVDRDLVAEADVRPESLRVVRLDDGTWEPVSSDVTVDGDQVDVRVDVPGFSRYAVVGQPETPTPTGPAPTPTATATDTATVAPGSPTPAPGIPFGLGLGELVALVAVVALVVAALLLARDRLPFEED
jgi:PGF-pre-PGF domain-containing protein